MSGQPQAANKPKERTDAECENSLGGKTRIQRTNAGYRKTLVSKFRQDGIFDPTEPLFPLVVTANSMAR
jgi:hypothetical protein